MYSFQYNQQDATLYNILYYCQCSSKFQAVSPPIVSSSKTVNTASGICRGELSYLAPLGSENISAPYFKQCFFHGGWGYYPPD